MTEGDFSYIYVVVENYPGFTATVSKTGFMRYKLYSVMGGYGFVDDTTDQVVKYFDSDPPYTITAHHCVSIDDRYVVASQSGANKLLRNVWGSVNV